MHKYNKRQPIIERHYGPGTIVARILTRYYVARFKDDLLRVINEKNTSKYNDTTGEIS